MERPQGLSVNVVRRPHARWRGCSTLLVALVVLLGVSGCGAVRGVRGKPQERGFLRDYSQLKKREGYEAQLVYVNPKAAWTSYDAILIDSVTLWVTKDTGRLSDEERQMLTDTLYGALHTQLGKYFELADRPAPGVLRLRAALTQAKGANVPLRTVTTVVPQMRVISTVVGLGADVAVTVGSATLEAEVLDSITNERLAAAVDERVGNKALLSTRTFQKWGDVEAAANFWAARALRFFLREGVQRKPGAPPPSDAM
jgi:hypothetical protein